MMALTELWNTARKQLEDKHVQQIIAFAGSGKLVDNSKASQEFREFLHHVPTSFLLCYADQCLSDKFECSGLALQDVINEAGRRLEFHVTDGIYRGKAGQIGFDGVWQSTEGHSIIVEVKTTDAYRIDLNSVAGYRRSLIKAGQTTEESSSILIIVGRADTGDLEAQIRGSRYAWDIRLISVDALFRLATLKEEVDDPQIVRKIRDILIPHEFTKLDGIIDVVFSATEDVKQETSEDTEGSDGQKATDWILQFHQACITRIEAHLNQTLVKRSRVGYSSPDESVALVCAVSKAYEKTSSPNYWFAFHPHHQKNLESAKQAYLSFGCGSEDTVVLIPYSDFASWLDTLHVTSNETRFYWHVNIHRENGKLMLYRKKGQERIDLSKFLLPKK